MEILSTGVGGKESSDFFFSPIIIKICGFFFLSCLPTYKINTNISYTKMISFDFVYYPYKYMDLLCRYLSIECNVGINPHT